MDLNVPCPKDFITSTCLEIWRFSN